MRLILVIGESHDEDEDRYRFKKEAAYFVNRLMAEFSFSENDYAVISGTEESVRSQLELNFLRRIEEDILLCYIGHGAENGWALSGFTDKEVLFYDNLRLLLAPHRGNLIFLNACCYALAAKEAILSRFGNYLLIGATSAEYSGLIENFLKGVLNYWKAHTSYPTAGKVWILREKNLHLVEAKLWRGNESLNSLMYPPIPKLLTWQRREP